jgi:hypothetical protein
VDAQPVITLAELQARLAEEEVVVSQTAIFRGLTPPDPVRSGSSITQAMAPPRKTQTSIT